MPETRISTNFCRINRHENVQVEEEALTELGREGIMSWRVKKCLDIDETCKDMDCKYAPRGIGDVGNTDPFN